MYGIKIKKLLPHTALIEKRDAYSRYICPFCGKDTFLVSESEDMYLCPSCGSGGNEADFLYRYKNLSGSEIFKKKTLSLIRSDIHKVNKAAADIFHKNLMKKDNKGYEYLSKKRKLSEQTLERFYLGYCPENDTVFETLLRKFPKETVLKSGLFTLSKEGKMLCKFQGRVIFPIFDIDGKIAGFGGRVLDSVHKPKYLNSSESDVYDKSSILYGMNFAYKSKSDHLILCEGYMDVISLHEAGFDCAIAPLGTALTDTQVNLIRLTGKRIILMQDSDAAGREAKKKAMLKLKGIPTLVADLNPAKDPDEFIKTYGPDAMHSRILNSVPYLKYAVSTLKKEYDPNNFSEYMKFGEELTKLIYGIS